MTYAVFRRNLMISLALLACHAKADIVTFESTPTGATPVDDSILSTPYTITGGSVRFFFDTNGNNKYDAGTDVNPLFEQTGNDGANGFGSTFNGVQDTARPGYESVLGNFFLRQPDNTGVVPGPFIAAYSTSTPIHALSGEIWDIDGSGTSAAERWRVDILDANGNVLATQLSPNGVSNDAASLDSLPWTFQFTGLPDGVAAVRADFVGTRDRAGLAFNNFSPDVALPEPGGVVIFLALSAALLRVRRR